MASVIASPFSLTAQPAGIDPPALAALAIFPLATADVERSIIIGGFDGIPEAIGLVERIGEFPPTAGITAGPLVKIIEIISASSAG